MDTKMNTTVFDYFLYGLATFVITCILVGLIDAFLPIFPDNTILTFAGVLGGTVFVINLFRQK